MKFIYDHLSASVLSIAIFFILVVVQLRTGETTQDQTRYYSAKTHLLQAICQTAMRERPDMRLYYISCEGFMTQFLEAEDFRMRRAARASTAALGGDRARRALEAYYPDARTSRERRVIEAALAGPRQ